ncbi:MAG: hypothetical protein ACK5WF_14810 [Cyclobacteriaceae bacterium]
MCHFITGLITKQTTLEEINAIGRNHVITFDVCNNSFVRSQLNADEIYLAKRTKYCDCDTQVGMKTRTDDPTTRRIDKRELDKLKSKGWSETKIARWLADREKSVEKDKVRYDQIVNGTHTDIENWLGYIHKLFAETTIPRFGLLLHWYASGTESERIKVKGRVIIRLTELTPDVLLGVEEDTVYEFRR